MITIIRNSSVSQCAYLNLEIMGLKARETIISFKIIFEMLFIFFFLNKSLSIILLKKKKKSKARLVSR
jgi:hypothetical protein